MTEKSGPQLQQVPLPLDFQTSAVNKEAQKQAF